MKKIFGSLTSSSSQRPSSLQSTLWSLTDDEVERREWRRGDTGSSDRDEIPCSSSFDELIRDRRRSFRRELQHDLDDGEHESNTLRSRRMGTDGLDEWDIRSSIGLDRTLDNEEEEDQYDKVASGRENAGERLYMKNVTDQESYFNIHNVLPKSLHGKDPRANHMAAKIRLQEDEAEAQKLNFNHNCDTEVKEPHDKASNEGGRQLRSILKRKEFKQEDNKSVSKRVRFEPGCKIVCKEEASQKIQANSVDTSSLNSMISDDEYMPSQKRYGIPDYLQNSSKYTHYSFNSSSEVEGKSNTLVGFLELVEDLKSTGSESALKDVSGDLPIPKSVTFIPKKKAGELKAGNFSSKVKQDEEEDGNQSLQQRVLPVGIAAGESQGSEADIVEEDKTEADAINKSEGAQKASRKYRTKSGSDESDP